MSLNHSENEFWLGLTGVFFKGFSLFSLYYVEVPSTPQRTTSMGQLCFKVSCKFSEWPSSELLPPLPRHVYQRSNCSAVSTKRQILTARRCLPSSGDRLAPHGLFLRAASVPPSPTGFATHLGSVECGLSSTELNSCIFIVVEGTWALLPPTCRSGAPSLRADAAWAGTRLFSWVVWSISGATTLQYCCPMRLVKVGTEPC